jgi:hypothetical protein
VDGTFWTDVNTTDDALAGAASSYEGVFPASGRNISFCLDMNPEYTDDSVVHLQCNGLQDQRLEPHSS